MPQVSDIDKWMETITSRYENYLKTSFYFRDPVLRKSFEESLRQSGALTKGPFPEPARHFKLGVNEQDLAERFFSKNYLGLYPALNDRRLYIHQEHAIRASYADQNNVVVATGTASGKTESFLYPILFTLYQQYLEGGIKEPGVRALILYPMNALANDQRERLGEICKKLEEKGSGFVPTFGQYIGQTPKDTKDDWRNATTRKENRLPGELVFREEMRETPPHILLTNYSMLEYLLIRPDDSPLFDNERSSFWQYIVLDEAHQYKGAKGMEMGMLIRRLKQRLRDGGREEEFRCIATSATISTGETEKEKMKVAEFASELFGENFFDDNIIFGERETSLDNNGDRAGRYHVFLRALEGAFLIHQNGKDIVKLNREESYDSTPLEIALCKECGQHYYVGNSRNGKLQEAIRDPSHFDFGVEYFLPLEEGSLETHFLCRSCSILSSSEPDCKCNATISVRLCERSKDRPDQIKKCETCGYMRGGMGDPVQEIIHGSDGPNTVIVTALHELQSSDSKKILAFADSRQEAAFFAWYAEDSYQNLRERNLLLRSFNKQQYEQEGLSIEDLQNRLVKEWENYEIFNLADTRETKERTVLTTLLGEALTNDKRLSLEGVGLIEWYVQLPNKFDIPPFMLEPPWSFTKVEATTLLSYLLDNLRNNRALSMPNIPSTPVWNKISSYPQRSVSRSKPNTRKNVFEWGGKETAIVKHLLPRLLTNNYLSREEKQSQSVKLMKNIWNTIRHYDQNNREKILEPATSNGTFWLNYRWLRLKKADPNKIYACKVCANLTSDYLRGICPRNRCPGDLEKADGKNLQKNHYRILYESSDLRHALHSEEHTAQIDNDVARDRQEEFKRGEINLLSSSTTFEVGVDLGDLEIVFLRNVPPETFNYTQRVGRAGRRDTPGLAVTYCRRNPHDLYHYENPEKRVMHGEIKPPYLQMTNEKIIMRHMTAVVLAAYFKNNNRDRFENVQNLVGDWEKPTLIPDIRNFCNNNPPVKKSLSQIVPEAMHNKVGLLSDQWIDLILGEESRFYIAQLEVCSDYTHLEDIKNKYIDQEKYKEIDTLNKRKYTIAKEGSLAFLSRKAIIPKYGFPVDVVELRIPNYGGKIQVSLQRDLSQAIAEYAAGSKVVANKKEWESYGVKTIQDKELPIKYFEYDDARNFHQWEETGSNLGARKYLSPVFGFVTRSFAKPKEPYGRTQRLYTTRPFFQGFTDASQPSDVGQSFGITVTKALPGKLIILCEGYQRRGFYICRSCGMHTTKRVSKHKTPWNTDCHNILENFSLGHELVTDVIKLHFPDVTEQWHAYSLAYAVLLGASETLQIPQSDLNVTITGEIKDEAAIVLYDNVPGGAGLVAQFENQNDLRKMLIKAKDRVSGGCGCDLSCYGCLRSYRNQFAHPYLSRKDALDTLSTTLNNNHSEGPNLV